MDEARFDSLTRTLGEGVSRRLTLGALLGGALEVLGLADAEARKSGKCQPACSECNTCKKGKCQKTRRGRKCKKGKCQPLREGTPCTTGTCQNGNCVAAAPPPPPFQGICTAKDNACVGPPTTIVNCSSSNEPGSTCMCVVTTAGAIFCADNSTPCNNCCGDCTTDAECRQQTGNPNAVCTRGGPCHCGAAGPAVCWLPCPTMA